MQISSPAALGASNALTDEEIVEQVVAGQSALFEVLMRRHNERVYRLARSIVRDDGEAEDVMQQAYVNAYTHLGQFSRKARFSTWLLRIATNEALARVRRRGRYEPFDDQPAAFEDAMITRPLRDPEQQASSSELRVMLVSAIDGLPDGSREVFVLRDVEGLSTAETAAVLDVSEDVIKTRLSRARAALRRALEQQIGAIAPDVFRFYRPRCDRIVERVLVAVGGRGEA
jgi:RNA polymerase sigma-70 factor (ECF subfamily)